MFRAGAYRAVTYVTLQISIVGDGGPFLERTLTAASMAELLPENGVTVEVVHGRRTHFKITPPENLETSLRNDIAKALGDHQKLSAEQQKLRPMKVEIAGQMELIDPEKLLGIRPGSYERGYGGAF